jgi:hypothetical protein
MMRALAAALAMLLGVVAPAAAQTVIYPDPPPQPRTDSARPPVPGARADTTAPGDAVSGTGTAPAAPPQPPAPPRPEPPRPAPTPNPVLARACTDMAEGEPAPDLLGIVFESIAEPSARDAAIASVGGKRLAGAAEDEFQYVQVPAGGSDFRLRVFADRLIRLRAVSEVGPVTCPGPAPVPRGASDSASS